MTELTIIIPAKNEAENIAALVDEIHSVCEARYDYEVIVIDDGSTDATGQILAERLQSDARLRLLSNRQSGGQSAAVHSGVLAARGRICCTLDGDGQNPPPDIPKLVDALLADPEAGLVAGQRVGRQDTWSKRYASKFANALRARVLQDGTRDTGCGLKAFRRDAFLLMPFFNHMHRYLPALFAREGLRVLLVDVSHRPRLGGQSNYNNFQRAMVGIVDLCGVAWLLRRKKTARPTEILVKETGL
ncbi:glycosyltransferase family 2 protein [Thioclava sp. GXIMD4216]|uniref:Glycosyltransferase family 2 protein n=1 Tax=Thioclava litoralis TaxID=3076557 RepID=A0ABZ1E312_9RHOB|nr:glycosyltransferase family 2 protein [Thioclava sp. FTW29]